MQLIKNKKTKLQVKIFNVSLYCMECENEIELEFVGFPAKIDMEIKLEQMGCEKNVYFPVCSECKKYNDKLYENR